MIASGFAAVGDVETAGRMGIEMRRDHLYYPAGKGRLASYEWSDLAMRAAEHGHKDAARQAFETAIESMEHDPILKEDEREEKKAGWFRSGLHRQLRGLARKCSVQKARGHGRGWR